MKIILKIVLNVIINAKHVLLLLADVLLALELELIHLFANVQYCITIINLQHVNLVYCIVKFAIQHFVFNVSVEEFLIFRRNRVNALMVNKIM